MADASRDWIRDALRQTRDEVLAFLRVAVNITFSPRRFGRAWAAGEAHALNPLGFLATSFAVTSLVLLLVAHALGHTSSGSDEAAPTLLSEALSNLGPFGYYLLFGALQHATLRAFGLRRPLRDTLAMALYAGGGPAALLTLIAYAAFMPLANANPSPSIKTTALVLLVAGYGVFMGLLSTALAGLFHPRVRVHHLFLANTVAILVSGFVMGFGPPGQYGLHFRWSLHHRAKWEIDAALSTGR